MPIASRHPHLPGTEIFAAETGEPKSGQETSSVRRDPGPGTRPANMAEETALLGVCLEAGISGATGWWRRKGPNCHPPTQSSNRSLTSESGTEIFDAETGA